MVLESEPITRNSDVHLYVQCARCLGAEELDDLIKLEFNPESVIRVRRHIQNDEKLYPPSLEVKIERLKRQVEAREYFRKLNSIG